MCGSGAPNKALPLPLSFVVSRAAIYDHNATGGAMKLTEREIELITTIPKRRRDRKLGAWLGLAVAVAAFSALPYLGPQYDSLGPIIGILLGFATGEVARVHFRVTPEDKLIELLQRYISRDPEAVRQFSMQDGSSQNAV